MVQTRRIASGPSRVPVPASHSMRETETAIIPSGMHDWFSQPPGYTWHSFDTSTSPWPRQLTTPSSSYTMKPSKNLPSVTLPSWGPASV